jgi:nucleotide-binding universal stress UspA family protein
MSYRSILLYLDQSPTCDARTQAAIRLARRLDCHLAGLAPTGLLDLPGSPGATLSDLAALAWDSLRDEAERAADRFRDACVAGGLRSVETVIDEAEPAASLIAHAHCSDLTVLTQADPSAPGHRGARAVVEQVLLYSARPTLLLPHACSPQALEKIGSKAIVAWDESCEAVRALNDALPLLQQASAVEVVRWNPPQPAAGEPAVPRLDALRQWLAWHGVAADMRVETTSIDVADALLSHAADFGADLIVMGAYGHSRWTERVLGGVTRQLIGSATVPLLMSH